MEIFFASATESIEVAQAMFSMPLICNLNYFFQVCSFDQALPAESLQGLPHPTVVLIDDPRGSGVM